MLSKLIRFLQVVRLIDLRFSVRVAAAAGQDHTLIMKAHVVDHVEFIVRNNLLKRPEEIIRPAAFITKFYFYYNRIAVPSQ